MQHSKRRKWRERILSVFLSFAMILNTGAPLSPLFAKAADAEIFTEKGGYENGAYAEWKAVSGAAGYKAYIQKGSTKTLLDDKLIRQYPDNIWRVDALGLAAGDDYKLVVEAYASESAESPLATYSTDTISVITHDRNGFAFTDPSGQYPGAYDKNGVLRSDAKVIYVDNTNFDTVPLTIKKDAKGTELTLTGVQNIVNTSGFWKYAEYNDFKALDIRVIGLVNTSGFPKSSWGSSSEGLQIKGNGKLDTPITIEGVGDDATVYGFGIFARSSSHVEISNLGIMCFADDGVSLDTDNSYTWVHNCDIFYGSTGGDADQAKGDGTIDVKGDSKYQTYSYNHFWDSGKASLCGMKSETGENFITYHHNWFDHSDSRHPRVRTMSVHAYNNFYDGVAKYGAGAAYRSSIFMEKNYFRNAKYPMLSSMQGGDIFDGASPKDSGTFSSEDGGIIKAYENAFEGNVSIIPYGANNYIYKGAERAYDLSGASSTEHFDAYFVSDRTMEVPEYVKAYQGGSTYTNFDTIEDLGVDEGSIQEAVAVPSYVMAHAGRVGGGDLWWEFDDAADDVSYEVNSALKAKVVAYKTALKTIGGFSGTVIPASIRDESYVRVTGDRTAASERYKAGTQHTLHEVELSTDVEVKTYTPVDGYSFNAATYLTAVGADTTAASYTIENPDVAVYANFGLVSPRTVSGKTDRIALAKSSAIGSCGSFTIKNVTAAKKVIRFVLTADGAAKTAYYKVVKGDTVLRPGSVTGTAAQTVEVDIDGKGDGDYSLIYDADNLANSGSIRIISAEVDTVEVISGGAEPDNTDYALKVVKGANVTTDLADTTHKKKDAVTFTASVTDAEKYKLSVSIRKGTGENSGAAVSYSYTGNDYRFTMPASDVTVTLSAVEKTAEVVEPDTEFFDVTFEYDGNTKRVSVEEGKSVASSDVPDMSAYANFVCWSTDGTESGYVVPEELKITADVTIIAVIKESLYEVDDDFVAATFLSDIGAFTLPFGALQDNSAKKGLANAWLASAHEGYDPLVYKRFTLHNWKIPSKNTDTVGIVSGNTAETCGYVEIDAPAAASLTIVARAAGSGKTSYFTLTGPDGRVYEPTAGSNKVSGSGKTTLTYKLGVAGVYTIALDIDKQKADTNSGELRFYEIHLKGVVDEEADPTHEVRFLQHGDPITELTVAHGGFIPANAIPSPSLMANQEFLGWSSTTDEADIVDTDKILASNVLSDQTWTAIIGETGADAAELYTVTYHIGSTEYTESVKAGEMLSDIPAVTAPAGKKFNGWSETEGGTVLTAAALAALTVSADKDLYAVFENVAGGAVAHVYDYTGVNYSAKGVKLDLSTGVATAESFYTVAGSKKNNTYTSVDCPIDNKTYGAGTTKTDTLKLEKSAGTITFTTTTDGLELTIIGLKTDSSTVKVDDVKLTKSNGIYKTTINSGDHKISRGDAEEWIAAVYLVEPDNSSKPEYTLTVNTTGVETSLKSGKYYEGSNIKFSAKPMDGSVNMVVKKGDTTLEPGEDGLYSITMNADASVNMIAEKDVAEYHNVNVTAQGVNTSLTAGRYAAGTVIDFTASAIAGYEEDLLVAVSKTNSMDDASVNAIKDNGNGSYTLTVGSDDIEVLILAEKKPVTGISLKAGGEIVASSSDTSIREITLGNGKSLTLEAVLSPSDATALIGWTSEDESKLTVNKGRITAKSGTGTVKVTATADDASVSLNVKLTAVQPTQADIRNYGSSIDTLTLKEGESTKLTVAVVPVASTVSSAVWSADKEEVAKIAQDGTLTAVAEGTAVITVTVKGTEGKAVTDSITVKVVKEEEPVTEPEENNSVSVNLSVSSCTLKPEETLSVNAVLDPVDAEYKSVSWSSADEKVATVSYDSLSANITAVAEGSTKVTFTLTLTDGTEISADIAVTVTKEAGEEEKPAPTVPDEPEVKKSGIVIEGLDGSFDYTGAKVIPVIKVVDYDVNGGKVLVEGRDYTVKYADNVKGTASVTVTGKGNYTGRDTTGSFVIKEVQTLSADALMEVGGAKLGKIEAVSYTGSAICPDISFKARGGSETVYSYDSDAKLYKTADGNILKLNAAFSNNINKGTATILLTGKDKSLKKTFKIIPYDISIAAKSLSVKIASSAVWSAKGALPSAELSFNGEQLVEGRDYVLKASGNKKTGTATLNISGKGNFAKSLKKSFTVTALDLKDASINAVNLAAGMKASKVKAVVSDASGNVMKAGNYSISVKAADGKPLAAGALIEAGKTYIVTVNAKNTEKLKAGCFISCTVKAGNSINSVTAKISGLSKTYTGSAVTLTDEEVKKALSVSVKKTKLTYGKDYVITGYSNNVKKGTATAYISGIGDYSGMKLVKFKITAKTMILKNN